MMNQIASRENSASARKVLYTVGGMAGLTAGVLFLVALADLLLSGLVPGAATNALSLLENNWLVVLFKLNAGFNGITYDQLHELNPLDIAILMLVALMYLGLCAALWHTSKVGSIVAALQPFLGLVLFMATQTAGRSGVMGAGLVISLVMLRSDVFGKPIAGLGILASLVLLIGDLGTTPGSQSSLLAILLGIGYVLLTAWFFLVGQRLVQFGQASASSTR